MALNPVQKWLHSVLGPYRHRQEVYADVDRTLQAIPSLSPRTETYTYDDGRTVLLLTLQGTIPITFRGATYNIPIAYWLPHEYPREAPIAYVVPATNMLVRQSKSVELSGLIKDDSLQAWSRKWEGNNLLSLTENLQGVFSREPPLYAKPAQSASNGARVSSPPQNLTQGQQHRTPGPRPPPAPPGASSSHVQPTTSPAMFTNQHVNSSPPPIHHHHHQHQHHHQQQQQQQHQQSVAPGSPGTSGPPMRPQKPWISGQTPYASPEQSSPHTRSASMSSMHQQLAPPLNVPTISTQPNPQSTQFGQQPYQQQHSQQQVQAQPPMRPPIPQGFDHHRSASMGHAVSPSQGFAIQPQSPTLNGASNAGFLQHTHHQPVASTSQSPMELISPYAPGASTSASVSRGPPPESQHVPQQQVFGYNGRLGYDSQIPAASTGQTSSGPSVSSLSRGDPRIAPHQSQTPPPPSIPPRPDALRQSTPIQQARPTSRTFTTPVNILDDDDDETKPVNGKGTTSAPPPRPTNPEMLNLRRALYSQLVHHLNSLKAHLDSENGHLNALHEDLLKGEPAITDEMQRLEAVRDVCASARDRMKEVVDAAERNINDLTYRKETEVDELVCGTNVVHNQLLELVAEDNALEDTIYHLGRYFNADTRTQEELERFLKRTRILAREQFMKRSLINKILLDIALTRAQRN